MSFSVLPSSRTTFITGAQKKGSFLLDKTGMTGTGKWMVQQAADSSVAAPTIAASLDCRYLSGLKEERESAKEETICKRVLNSATDSAFLSFFSGEGFTRRRPCPLTESSPAPE